MAIERADVRIVRKPWGNTDLRPWSEIRDDGGAIGELWFQRSTVDAPNSSLLFKLLFTNEPLSIQVHPGDAYARSIGLEHGKTEAWYILSAKPGAKIAVGLKRPLSPAQLRISIEDGSIANIVQWRSVAKDDVIFVPAGTIHAIGARLVVAEIQQRSDVTFRMFDHGRQRELHMDNAVAVANARPADGQPAPQRLTDVRTLLLANPHFVLEWIDLTANSRWELRTERETWMFVTSGVAEIGSLDVSVGNAVFMDTDRADIAVGAKGLEALVAYLGPELMPDLLHTPNGRDRGPRVLRSLEVPIQNRMATVSKIGAAAAQKLRR